jgi:hypothetical protein
MKLLPEPAIYLPQIIWPVTSFITPMIGKNEEEGTMLVASDEPPNAT